AALLLDREAEARRPGAALLVRAVKVRADVVLVARERPGLPWLERLGHGRRRGERNPRHEEQHSGERHSQGLENSGDHAHPPKELLRATRRDALLEPPFRAKFPKGASVYLHAVGSGSLHVPGHPASEPEQTHTAPALQS